MDNSPTTDDSDNPSLSLYLLIAEWRFWQQQQQQHYVWYSILIGQLWNGPKSLKNSAENPSLQLLEWLFSVILLVLKEKVSFSPVQIHSLKALQSVPPIRFSSESLVWLSQECFFWHCLHLLWTVLSLVGQIKISLLKICFLFFKKNTCLLELESWLSD